MNKKFFFVLFVKFTKSLRDFHSHILVSFTLAKCHQLLPATTTEKRKLERNEKEYSGIRGNHNNSKKNRT